MNKVKFLQFIIIGLLISNSLLLYHFTPLKKHPEPKYIIIKELNFNSSQIILYEKYIQQHRKAMHKHRSKMNLLRTQLYETLQHNNNSKKVHSLIHLIGKEQETLEQIHYQHFLDIKKICSPKQKQAFNNLTVKIPKLFKK